MIVGTTSIEFEDIRKFINKPNDLVEYVTTLVPTWARHIDCLVHNQRFYVAIHIRGMLTIPYKQRVEMTKALTSGIRIKGVISSFTSIYDIIDLCDKELLVEMLKGYYYDK